MAGSGSALFTDADDYRASLPAMTLLVTGEKEFRARLTWMALGALHLLQAQETAPRVAYIPLPLKLISIAFPVHRSSTLICDGLEVRMGDLIFHKIGARVHQRTTGATAWGSIALTPASLRSYGKTLAGREVRPPASGQILRPLSPDWRGLLRLHAEAIRIAETKLSHIGHPEVARALEQDLIWALVTCLATAEPRNNPAAEERSRILSRFEAVLAADPARPLRTSEMCRRIDVSEQSLRALCLQSLGMSPARYQRLRRRQGTHGAGARGPNGVMTRFADFA